MNWLNTCLRYVTEFYQKNSQMNMNTHQNITCYLYHMYNFHTRQLDNKVLIIPLYKTVKQQRHSVYRGSKLRN